MHAQNSYGDTVLHSLVKYSAVYPNKTDNVIDMFKYLNGLLKKGKSTMVKEATLRGSSPIMTVFTKRLPVANVCIMAILILFNDCVLPVSV
jgi:hypothetical protein